MTLAHWLFRTAQAHPQSPAVALGPRSARSYEELARAAAALAGWLRRSGARRVKPVAIVSENRVEIVETLFAVWNAGYTAAPIDPSLEPEDLARRLAFTEAEVCFVSPRASAAVMAAAGPELQHVVEYEGVSYHRALRAEPQSTPLAASNKDVAWLAFSDREPGEAPRAAMLSHASLMSLALSMLAEIDSVKPRDAQIHALPWTGPEGFTLLPTLARGGVNVMPETGAFDAAELFENAGRWRRASTLVSDWHLRALLDSEAPMDQADFRAIVVNGGGVSRPLIERGLQKFGPRLARIYGQCAFPLGMTRLNSHDVSARSEDFWAERIGSVGRPYLTTEISIRGEDGRRCLEPAERGWIYARGQHGMRGYWRDRRSRVGQGDAVWRRCGMLGALDRHGYLSVLGAPDYLLPTPDGGSTAPESLEAALVDDGQALDAGAVTRPVDKGDDGDAAGSGNGRSGNGLGGNSLGKGEEIVVFLEKDRAGPAPSLLDPAETAPLAIAARYEVSALPRSANGRLRRATLKRWALERAAAEREQPERLIASKPKTRRPAR